MVSENSEVPILLGLWWGVIIFYCSSKGTNGKFFYFYKLKFYVVIGGFKAVDPYKLCLTQFVWWAGCGCEYAGGPRCYTLCTFYVLNCKDEVAFGDFKLFEYFEKHFLSNVVAFEGVEGPRMKGFTF